MGSHRTLNGFVVAIAIAGVAASFALPRGTIAAEPELFLVLLGMTALAGMYPISLAGTGVRLTMTHPLILGTLAVLGPRAAIASALTAVVAATFVREDLRRPIRVVFNFSEVALSTSLAALAFQAVGGGGPEVVDFVLPLFVATAVFFVVNTGLVAGVVALDRGESFPHVWRRSFGWATPAYFAAVTISLGIVLLLTELGSWALSLALPPCWLLAAFYRMHDRAIQAKQNRIAEVEALNAELRDALAKVKTLEGVLPICMHCKSIRDDDDTWRRLEAYVQSHSKATFTHGLCDHCHDEHYVKAGS